MMPTRTTQKIARAIALTKGVSCRPAREPMTTIIAASTKRLTPSVARRRLNLSWTVIARYSSNENKMSDGGRGRVSRGVKMSKSSQKWSVRQSAVRSIAWLGLFTDSSEIFNDCESKQHILFCVVHRGLEVGCMHCPISDVPELLNSRYDGGGNRFMAPKHVQKHPRPSLPR